MDSRQSKIEKLVTQYFRERPDVTLERGSSGDFVLTLLSPHALSQFGGKEQVHITFDEERAFHNPDWELINATHPYLEVIRNDLASTDTQDPRLTEAHFPPQPISPVGVVTVPRVEIDGPIVNVGFETEYEPHFVLTYKVVFESDERQDYILRLCYNARTAERRDDIVQHLYRLPLEEGKPTSLTDRGKLCAIEDILHQGRLEIDSRVGVEVAATAKQYADRLAKERERLEQHYEGEISRIKNKRDEDSRRRLRENLKKEIEEFEKKYAFRSRTYLISVLLLWTPCLSYRIQASSQLSDFFVDGIKYDSGADLVVFQKCGDCGNEQRFTLCCAGRHAFCGESSCSTRKLCATCADLYCAEHGKECSQCLTASCLRHRTECAYGPHPADTGFCPRCLKSSYDQKIICIGCATACELCARTFPRQLIASCHVGNEQFCTNHAGQTDGDLCSECGNAVCKKHGREAQDRKWACIIHSHEASCCNRVFGNSQLVPCVVVTDELLCESHRLECVVGNEDICEKHMVRSWQGEALCPLHCDQCIRCLDESVQRIYRSDKLDECAVCRGRACVNHLEQCQVCEVSKYCVDHKKDRPTCPSCSRISCGARGCSANSSTCKLCAMSYCRHCMESTGVCTTCSQPDPMGRASQAFPLLEALGAGSDETLKDAAKAMLKSFDKCRVLSSENDTYRVVAIHFKPSPMKFWQKERKLRVVADRNGRIVKALLGDVYDPEKAYDGYLQEIRKSRSPVSPAPSLDAVEKPDWSRSIKQRTPPAAHPAPRLDDVEDPLVVPAPKTAQPAAPNLSDVEDPTGGINNMLGKKKP